MDTASTTDKVIIQRFRVQLGLDPDTGLPEPTPSNGDPSQHLRHYVSGTYTGAAFDSYGRNDPFVVTPDDFIAVTMLSIQIKEGGTSGIRPSAILDLQTRNDEITSLLTELPMDRELHTLTSDEFDRWLGPDSPGSALYALMRQDVSLPRVATHKLLARKRPLLLPIRDNVVQRALGLGRRKDGWWRPWWIALSTDHALVARLRETRQRSDSLDLSLLRVADIVIWLQNR